MKRIKFDKAYISDALEFLELISDTAADEERDCSDVDELIKTLENYLDHRILKTGEAKAVSNLTQKYSSMVDEELRTRFSARVRKRKERRVMADEGEPPARVNISGTTKSQLDKMKNKENSKGEKRYPTYDAVIKFLLQSYEKKRESKRSKKK